MAAKQMEVFQWLHEVFEDSELPQFDKTESNINKLHELMVIYKEAFKDVEKVNEYLQDTALVYEKKYKEAEENLNVLGASPAALLDSDEQKCLDSLGTLNRLLSLRSYSPTNVMLAINSLEEEKHKVEEALGKEKQVTESLFKLSKAVANNLEELESIADDAEGVGREQADELEKEKKRCEFIVQKKEKYNEDIKSMEDHLRKLGFEDDLQLSNVSKKYEELSKVEKQLADLKTTLDSYSLPPDMALAEIEVENMREKLSEAMNRIAHKYSGSQC